MQRIRTFENAPFAPPMQVRLLGVGRAAGESRLPGRAGDAGAHCWHEAVRLALHPPMTLPCCLRVVRA